MPTGYIFTTEIWDGAEPKSGPTVRWLCENSKRFNVWMGTSFLEADGEDFFNTFVLATPDGKEAGRVRKCPPAAFEAYFTVGSPGSHVIDT
jgi:N-carbamoylputrescine amidase